MKRLTAVAAAFTTVACTRADPIVRDWLEELDRPVSVADYRLKNAYCSAAAESNRAGADTVRRRCRAVAFDVLNVVRPKFPALPLPAFPTTLVEVKAQEACKAACEALAYADRASTKWAPSTAEVAARCAGVAGCAPGKAPQ